MNFCSDALSPILKCNKPSADGYELENLIKTRNGRIKGFCSEGFTRPPLDISVEFPIAIDVACVIIGTKLREKYSTGFSLFVTSDESICKEKLKKSFSDPCSSKESNTRHLYKSSSLPCLTEGNQPSSLEKDTQFFIGKWFTNTETSVLLKNLQYKHWLSFPLPNFKVQERTYQGTLKHPNRVALKCVKSLTLRILKVSPTGSPVLSHLEIWGQPAVSSDPSLRKALLQKWLSTIRERSETRIAIPRIYNSLPDDFVTANDSVEKNGNAANSSINIPEEFFDPLTCEVMVVPLLLPSGNSIDAHSLERFIANEAIWGRPSSDPFTGVQFKSGFKPVPNVHLKSRIDRFFLTQNFGSKASHTVSATTDQRDTLNLGRSNLLKLKRKAEEEQDRVSKLPKKKPVLEMSSEATEKGEEIVDSVSSPECNEADDINKDIRKALRGKISYIPRRIVPRETKQSSTEATKSAEDFLVSSKLLLKQQENPTADKPPLAFRAKESSRHYVQAVGAALHTTQKQPSLVKPLHTRISPDPESCSELPRPPHLTTPNETPKDPFSVSELYSEHEDGCVCGSKEGLYSLKCLHVTCRDCLLKRPPLPFGAVQCQQCGTISHRQQIIRKHPMSMFS